MLNFKNMNSTEIRNFISLFERSTALNRVEFSQKLIMGGKESLAAIGFYFRNTAPIDRSITLKIAWNMLLHDLTTSLKIKHPNSYSFEEWIAWVKNYF